MSDENETDAIIFPKRGKHSPQLGPMAVIAGTESDLVLLCDALHFDTNAFQKLFTSRLYLSESFEGVSLTGPVVGAPYAAMVLENLIAWGAKKFIFLGWCGSISETVKIGDIIVPETAIIDEGTSGHYYNEDAPRSFPSASMTTQLKKVLAQNQIHFQNGTIWTTDAIYRETRQKVEFHQARGAIGVEMEMSALFTVADFRGVDICAMAVVSDELASLKWRPGFKRNEFKRGRRTACNVINDLCRKI
jgi:uridine phosphorylase